MGHISQALIGICAFFTDGRSGEREKRFFQRLRVRLLFEFGGRALGHDCAVIDNRDAMRDAIGLLHVVRGQEYGDALFFVELFRLRPELVAGLRVEAQSRLIEKDDFRDVQQAAGDFQTSAHAA